MTLLYALAARPGEIVSVETLLGEVWGAESNVEPQVVYAHRRWPRERLEEDPNRPHRLITVHGLGYNLIPRSKARCFLTRL